MQQFMNKVRDKIRGIPRPVYVIAVLGLTYWGLKDRDKKKITVHKSKLQSIASQIGKQPLDINERPTRYLVLVSPERYALSDWRKYARPIFDAAGLDYEAIKLKSKEDAFRIAKSLNNEGEKVDGIICVGTIAMREAMNALIERKEERELNPTPPPSPPSSESFVPTPTTVVLSTPSSSSDASPSTSSLSADISTKQTEGSEQRTEEEEKQEPIDIYKGPISVPIGFIPIIRYRGITSLTSHFYHHRQMTAMGNAALKIVMGEVIPFTIDEYTNILERQKEVKPRKKNPDPVTPVSVEKIEHLNTFKYNLDSSSIDAHVETITTTDE